MHAYIHFYISIYIYIRVHKLINFTVAVHNGSKEYSDVAIGERIRKYQKKKKGKINLFK